MAHLRRANSGQRAIPTRFPLGQIVATPGALAALQESGEEPTPYLQRHCGGDWGDLDEHDRKENEFSLEHGGVLEFGTELVVAADRSIVAMLGASPGASTAAWIMLHVLERCFGEKLEAAGWLPKLKQIIPSYGESLAENTALCRRVRAETAAVLHIHNIDDTPKSIAEDAAA